jgi:hypothetical protein
VLQASEFSADAIESVLRQTHPDVEIVVVDDGSPDNTRDVAARYAGVRYVRQDNQGLAAARNTGIRESRNPYLVFLDADDRLLPCALCGTSRDGRPVIRISGGRRAAPRKRGSPSAKGWAVRKTHLDRTNSLLKNSRRFPMALFLSVCVPGDASDQV